LFLSKPQGVDTSTASRRWIAGVQGSRNPQARLSPVINSFRYSIENFSFQNVTDTSAMGLGQTISDVRSTPRKRTCSTSKSMSAMCQKRTSGPEVRQFKLSSMSLSRIRRTVHWTGRKVKGPWDPEWTQQMSREQGGV